MYFGNWSSDEEIVKDFNEWNSEGKAKNNYLENAKTLFAWYGDGSYCGSAMVLFEKDGKLYEVNGSHCSCYGLENQWEPEEATWEELSKRFIEKKDGNDYYDDWNKAAEYLTGLIEENTND